MGRAGRVEFLFDFGSPPSYLAHTQLPGLRTRSGAEVVYRPVLLGAIFKATGNVPPGHVPAKRVWFRDDMKRYAARYGVPFAFPEIPVQNTLALMRGAFVAAEDDCLAAYCELIFNAIWVRGRDVQVPAVFAQTLAEHGFDPERYRAGIADAAIKQRVTRATQAAVDRGVFGVPAFFVGSQMFFGQDRLDFVESAVTERA